MIAQQNFHTIYFYLLNVAVVIAAQETCQYTVIYRQVNKRENVVCRNYSKLNNNRVV